MMQKSFFVVIGFFVLVALASIAFGFYAGSRRVAEEIAAMRTQNEEMVMRVGALEQTLDALAGDAAAMRQAFLEESQKQAQEQQKNLAALSESLAGQKAEISTLSQTSNITGLVAAWSPFVYKITCEFELDAGGEGEARGSAMLEHSAGSVRFITSRHVVEEEGAELTGCELTRPASDTEIEISADDVRFDGEKDIAYGSVTGAPPAMLSSQVCPTQPAIGDRVVILGYPGIGAKETITATEGIISGFDEDFYTTSAKIERGNSGGAAVDAGRSCFLGLPTLVFAGRVESLARILPLVP